MTDTNLEPNIMSMGFVYFVIMTVLWIVTYVSSLFIHTHERRLNRGAFIGWYTLLLSCSGLIVMLVVGFFSMLLTFANMDFEFQTILVSLMIVAPFSGWLNGKLISARLLDIGLPKIFGLMMVFPFVNLLFLISFSLMPSHSGSDFNWILSANKL